MKTTNKMKQLFVLFISAIFALQIQAKEIRIIKEGGEPCKFDKTKTCYDKIQIRSTEEVYSQSCLGANNELCPAVGSVLIGSLAFDTDNFVISVEQAILSGITSANGSIQNSNNQAIATYSWTGLINAAGFIKYEIIINDEV